LRRLPIRTVFRCGAALGRLGYYLAPPYRSLVLRNLQIAFGEEKSATELRHLARDHFAALGANLFSSLKIPHLSAEEIRELVEVEGLEHIHAGKEAGQGFTMVIGHIGNWELFAQISAIVFPCPVGTIYQALGNPHIDAEVRRSRAVMGLQLFERKEGFGKASQFIRAGGAVGISWISTPGMRACGVPSSAARLHNHSRGDARAAHRLAARPSSGAHDRGSALEVLDLAAARGPRPLDGGDHCRCERGRGGADPHESGGLVLGPQPVENAEAEIPPRHLQTRRPRPGSYHLPFTNHQSRCISAKAFSHPDPRKQLARRRGDDRPRGQGDQARTS
jgi:hypothetical protein